MLNISLGKARFPGAQLIDEDERYDFIDGVKEIGYKARDFMVEPSPRVSIQLPSGDYVFRQEVTIHRQSTGISRTFHGGHGYEWVAAALYDVEHGAFGAK